MALSAHHLKALAEILSIYMVFWCDGDGAGHEDPIDNLNPIRTVSSPQAVDIHYPDKVSLRAGGGGEPVLLRRRAAEAAIRV